MMAMLPPPPAKPITLPEQRGFSGGEKKKKKMKKKNRGREEKKREEYAKGDAELLEDQAYDYCCNSGTPLRDAVDSLKKKTNPPMEQCIT